MLQPYALPHLSYQQQAAQLISRGLIIENLADAERWLERVGYYRLRPYWNALLANPNSTEFRSGASLAHAVDLYLFDDRLRHCLLAGLARLEVALRVRVSHTLGRRGASAHMIVGNMDARKAFAHSGWLTKAQAQLDECREAWIEDFRKNYQPPIPVWMAVEAWSFKINSQLLGIMNATDKAKIAKEFVVAPDTFASWVRSCVTVRNSCAHYNRVWNKPLIDQPAIPKTWEAKPVQHISVSRDSQTRIYAVLSIVAYCLGIIGDNDNWKMKIEDLASTFPLHTGLTLQDAGFPSSWAQEPLWL